ncbi:Stk1 family PASTA domain-containing Ser/Thr kinase [Desulfitobacterium metallireducens]|uniref:non-specific serine/threonine protein kinase n=1 Tax=Desulfitobacterium metallireducens DSM 15288 TaxID=871968 RepID=W0EEJ8_9FIRM|nr:Stk1 family PASTA domain-containing Ser/Thr kinase [Desulfitobacterium metallireducens]AHF07634.1 serine/threonine protein kinase [Desulfitobacterium metallireducens DSM 15288]
MSKVLSDRYEIIEKIGVGGMAIVYKAKDLLLNRVVTIKVLREQFASDDDFVRRFRREAQSAASLSHPNIVSIYDVGKDGDTEYIVMEYVEGQNLKELIRNYAPLSSEQSINLARQIAEAIRHAHEHHIIHRDIKPHNILVTADGRAKVTDFGIARAVSAATMTHTGDIIGSVHYLSPEQAKGVQTNEQSDLYSLGIILYELLTGKVPYDGETPVAIALKHLQENPVPPSQLNPRISQGIENVILKAIAKAPERRYQTAVEFVEDLNHIQNGEPIRKIERPLEEDLDSTRIHKSLSNGVNAALSAYSKDEEPKPNQPQKKRKRWIWVTAAVILLLIGVIGFGFRNYIGGGTTKVPNFVGHTVIEAGFMAEKSNLKLDSNPPAEEYSDTVEKGKISSQDPVADTLVKDGRTIKIWVSKGPEMLKMPNLKTGKMTEEDAKNALKTARFTGDVNVTQDTTSNLPAGIVVGQNPPADILWAKNGKIDLQVSAGTFNNNQVMPNLVGKSVTEAQNILVNQMNLKVVIVKESSTEYPKEAVMATNPKPGDPIPPGTVITITVSDGPGPLA